MSKSCGCGCAHQPGGGTAARYSAETRVGDVAQDPAALAVLARFGVNHCCGAGLSMREGAAAAGARLDDLLAALETAAPVTT